MRLIREELKIGGKFKLYESNGFYLRCLKSNRSSSWGISITQKDPPGVK